MRKNTDGFRYIHMVSFSLLNSSILSCIIYSTKNFSDFIRKKKLYNMSNLQSTIYNLIQYFFQNIIPSIVVSLLASWIFWSCSFKLSLTKVIFSKYLAKPDDTLTDNRKSYGYRFRFANIGRRDLIELTVTIKFIIPDGTRDHILVPEISNSGKQAFMTFLPGRRTHKKYGRSNVRTMTFYPSESMIHELSKKKYSQKIRKLAKKGTLQFKDLFDEYGEKLTIRIYVYGNDKVTGARRMFESHAYTVYDIKEGDFIGAKKIRIPRWRSMETKQSSISQINRKYNV